MVILLKDFLQALRDNGQESEAVEVEEKIFAKFKDTSLTRDQLLVLDMNVINGTLNMAKLLRQMQVQGQLQQKQNFKNPLQLYVEGLQARGFSVAVNPEYQDLLEQKME